jgi:hypothetical protein
MKKKISFFVLLILPAIYFLGCYQHAQQVSIDTTPFYQKRLFYGDKLFGKILMRNGDVYNVESLVIDSNGSGHWDKQHAISSPLDTLYGVKDNMEYSIRAKDIKTLEVLTPSKIIVTSLNDRRLELDLIPGVRTYQRVIADTYDFGEEKTEIVVPLIDVNKMVLWSYNDSTVGTPKEHPFIP